MKAFALAYGPNKKNIDLMKRIGGAIQLDVEVVDVRSYKLKVDENNKDMVFLVFGPRAHKILIECNKGNHSLLKAVFPEPDRLESDAPENAEARSQAWVTLRALQQDIQLKKDKTLTDDSLPNLTATDVAILERTLKNKNCTSWSGRTKDGKSIKLSVEPTKEGTEDIKMTFAELYAIRLAMETLQIKEIEIVNNSSKDNR